MRDCRGQIDRRRRLTDAALLVRYRDNGSHLLSASTRTHSARLETEIVSRGTSSSVYLMLAMPADGPLGIFSTLRSIPRQRKPKVSLLRAGSGNLDPRASNVPLVVPRPDRPKNKNGANQFAPPNPFPLR